MAVICFIQSTEVEGRFKNKHWIDPTFLFICYLLHFNGRLWKAEEGMEDGMEDRAEDAVGTGETGWSRIMV